jgi:TonB family protein
MQRDWPRTYAIVQSACALTAILLTGSVLLAERTQTSDPRGVGIKSQSVDVLPASAKRFALVIGVSQYEDAQINKLEGAANDAKSLAETLIDCGGFPSDQVVLLTSDQPSERRPTRGNILRRLSNLRASVPKDGLLLVAFAGHGIERDGRAYLLPSDGQVSGDISLVEETAINVDMVRNWIRQSGVGQVIVILDACRNNPTATRGDAGQPLTEAYTRGFSFDIRNQGITAFATFYATEVGQVAYEYSERRQGYFTWALVEGLRGHAANAKGEVTLAGLVAYLQDTVPKRITIELGPGKKQRPYVVVEGYKADDLVLAVTKNVSVEQSFRPSVSPAELYATNGDKFAKQRNWRLAEAEYLKAIQLETSRAEFHGKLGYVFLEQQKVPEAESELRKASALKPESTAYRADLGRLYFVQRKYSEAENQFKEVINRDPKNALWWNDLGGCLMNQGKLNDAEQAYRRAVVLEPNDPAWHNDLGRALAEQGNLKEAEQALRLAVRLESYQARWHATLASILSREENWAEAQKEMEVAVHYDPANRTYQSRLEQVRNKVKIRDENHAWINPTIGEEPANTVDTKPVLVNTPRPRYTEIARRNKVQGVVTARILVDANGQVKQVIIIKGLPDGLNEQAERAAYQLRFRPATKSGEPVAFWQLINIEFALR